MVVSTNRNVIEKEFTLLLDSTVAKLTIESKKKSKDFRDFNWNKLENHVFEFMVDCSKNTKFQGTIELVSGQRFPDIVASKLYGVEVKSTTQNHWTTTGNSVLESTRIPGIEKIYLLFGKLKSPIEFKYRKYEECLSDVVVTHSPRYLVDMELSAGETIFDKLKMPYDELRKLKSPIKPILDYYRKGLKPGDEVWWLDSEVDRASNIVIKLWNNLSKKQKTEIFHHAFVLFPEILSTSQNKFNRLSIWLTTSENVVCPNIRDIFTAGGRTTILINNEPIADIPRIITHLLINKKEIKSVILNYNKDVLRYYWGNIPKNTVHYWIKQIKANTETMDLPFDIETILSDESLEVKISK